MQSELEIKEHEVNESGLMKLATETAESLSYLHFAVSVPVIHRDVKLVNILLDVNYVAKFVDPI